MVFLYNIFTHNIGSSFVSAIVMIVMGLLFAAVAGYLVGIIGSSSNPISGLTLTTLLIAALMMVLMGQTGDEGIKAVLGVAAVVCCVAGVAGDMIQDWKVGHILGATPWKMQIGGLIGVVAAALTLTFSLQLLHNNIGIGSETLPASGYSRNAFGCCSYPYRFSLPNAHCSRNVPSLSRYSLYLLRRSAQVFSGQKRYQKEFYSQR
jgi:putative OPT family oligopeptide transporter